MRAKCVDKIQLNVYNTAVRALSMLSYDDALCGSYRR